LTPTLHSPIVLEVQLKHHLVTLRVGYDEKRITLAIRTAICYGWSKHRHSSFAFELRPQARLLLFVVYELGGWASGVHQKTMQTMGIRLLRLWAAVCLASVSVAIFVVYMNGCSMGVEVLNHHPLKFREEANGVWRIRQLAQCFHHSSLALLILAQRVRGIYSHT